MNHAMLAEVTEQSSTLDSAIIAAFVAALVALAGYWQSGRLNRQDRQRQLFAEAYAAVRRYREFPFMIRRRRREDDVAKLSSELSSCQVLMDQHVGLLLVESAPVGAAYVALVSETRRVAGGEIREAWQAEPLPAGEPPHVVGIDLTPLDEADAAFLAAVRGHLSIVPTRLRNLAQRWTARYR